MLTGSPLNGIIVVPAATPVSTTSMMPLRAFGFGRQGSRAPGLPAFTTH
jgi:hypothetical protein